MNGNSINNEQLQQELATTQDQVASIIESFVELGVSIYDFPGTPEATKGMITNLQRNVDRLYKLNVRSNDPQSSLSKVDIPLEVVQYIEDGRNPDIYTREFVEAIRRSNQYQRGKMHGLKQLRDSLADKIVDEFPELKEPVEDIIKRTSPIDNVSNTH
ncbi:Mediator of RNA polymerase II transcription subunit 10 [Saccharomyces cerevisiae]|nr:Mediator of RNA polymerase II transcription subunit 10 [Saccharomyces cerevisiae]